MFLGSSIKNVCTNLNLHHKPLKTTLKWNSCVMSISCCRPVTLSSPTFPNIYLTKTTKNLPFVSNVTEKMAAIISISTLTPLMRDKNHFLIWHHFPSLLVNPSNPTFFNINLTKAIKNLLLVLKTTEKWLW